MYGARSRSFKRQTNTLDAVHLLVVLLKLQVSKCHFTQILYSHASDDKNSLQSAHMNDAIFTWVWQQCQWKENKINKILKECAHGVDLLKDTHDAVLLSICWAECKKNYVPSSRTNGWKPLRRAGRVISLELSERLKNWPLGVARAFKSQCNVEFLQWYFHYIINFVIWNM